MLGLAPAHDWLRTCERPALLREGRTGVDRDRILGAPSKKGCLRMTWSGGTLAGTVELVKRNSVPSTGTGRP
jgi:hypothetical protein